MLEKGIYFSFFFLAWVFLIVIFITIYGTPKLQQHPAFLIASLCLIQAIFVQYAFIQYPKFGIQSLICYYKIWKPWQHFTFQDPIQSFENLCLSQEIGFQYLQIVILTVNICFCYDLIQKLRNPFEIAKSRLYIYYFIINTFPAIIIIIIWRISEELGQQYSTNIYDFEKQYNLNSSNQDLFTGLKKPQIDSRVMFNLFLTTYQTIQLLWGIYSIQYSYSRLDRKGVSQQVRKLFLVRHSIYIIIQTVLWVLQTLNNYIELFTYVPQINTNLSRIQTDWIDRVSFGTLILGCIILGIIRLIDPFFNRMIMIYFYEIFGQVFSNNEEGIGSQVLSSFLTSSLNIELVYIILAGITRFSYEYKNKISTQEIIFENNLLNNQQNNQDKQIIERTTFEDSYIILDHSYQIIPKKQTKQMILNKIRIKNASVWDVAKYDQFVLQKNRDYFKQIENKRSLQIKKFQRENQQELYQDLLQQTVKTQEESEDIINEEVIIEEFACEIFQEIRQIDGIKDQDIQESLSPNQNWKDVFKAGESEGKSGSFFFFSHDKKFIIKTMFQQELDLMLQIIPQYSLHVQQNCFSLIARIYGVYKIKMDGIVPINILLMANTMQVLSQNSVISKVYDLKGSWTNRIVKKGQSQTLKDRNLLNCKRQRKLKNKKGLLQFKEEDIKVIMENIEKDVKLLDDLNLLDYSLLLAIEKLNSKKEIQNLQKSLLISQQPEKDSQIIFQSGNLINSQLIKKQNMGRHRYISQCGKYVYHISIIDYLTEFNFFKRFECFYKVYVKGNKKELISAVDSKLYSKRFLKFIKKEVIINENNQDLKDDFMLLSNKQ